MLTTRRVYLSNDPVDKFSTENPSVVFQRDHLYIAKIKMALALFPVKTVIEVNVDNLQEAATMR